MPDKFKEVKLDEMSVAEFSAHVQDWGCHCDAMNCYSCGHSAIIVELLRRLMREETRDAR